MELIIKTRNLDVPKASEEYIQQKIGKLERHLPSMDDVIVELSRSQTKAAEDRFTAQVTINSNGALLRGEVKATTINAAIDDVVDVLNRQIERHKGKLYRSQRKNKITPRRDLALDTEGLPQISRVKRFLVESMSPEEAADRMELLGHSFFLFFNENIDQFNVLYKRDDDTYGVIEPKFKK